MAKRVTPWNPNTADWLVAQRGSTNQDVIVDRLAELGQRISRSWLSRIENGEPFSHELLEAFQTLYGSVPPPYEEPDVDLPDDLAAAIREQAEAIRDLVEELRLSRAGQVEATAVAFQALGALGAPQDRRETQGDSERGSPVGTGR